MSSKERKERKAKLMADIRARHVQQRIDEQDPNYSTRIATSEELAETRRIIREIKAVDLSEADYFKAIHGNF